MSIKKLFILIITIIAGHYNADAQHQCATHKAKYYNSVHGKKKRAADKDNALMHKYDVHHYGLDINCENNSIFISGNATINAKATANIDTFAFELHSNHTVDSVKVNGVITPFVNNVHMRYVPTVITNGANFSVQIFYKGTCPTGGNAAIGNGYSASTSQTWGNRVSWSLSQPYVAYEWWPCKQFLTDKADSATIHVTTADTNKVGSNGLLQGVDTLPNNKLKFKWHTREPICYYLISVATSKYVDYSFYAYPSNMTDSILIQNYIYANPATLTNFKKVIDTTKIQMEKFSQNITPYPFVKEKYGHCMAPFSGGMEHQTMSSMGFFNFDLVSHELVHQWFGDYVTCSTWRDIWVNEGFATYGEYLLREMVYNKAYANTDMRNTHNRIKTQPGGSVYYTDTTDGNRMFSSRLTYDKGSAILHTLRFIIGDSAFFKSLRTYQTQFANSNATAEQFRQVAESVSGKNLFDWMNQWFYGEGYPIYNAIYNSNGSNVVINLKHTTSTGITTLFTTPVEIRVVSPTNGDTTIVVNVSSNNETYIIPTTKTITNLVIDPNNWVVDSTSSITKNPDFYATGINDIVPQIEINISPVPAMTNINISSNNSMSQLKIIDLNGRIVYQQSNMGKSITVPCESWSSGVYQCLISDEFGNHITKGITKQ